MRPILTALFVTGCLVMVRPGIADDDLLTRAAAAEKDGYLKQAFALYLQAWQGVPESSDDPKLRGALVRVAAQLDPPPEIPEEAERYAARGQVAFSEASQMSGFVESAAEFRRAIHTAPWWADATFNLALVEEKLGQYDDSIADMKVYLASEPPDADKVRAKLYQLEYRKERAPATVYVVWPHWRLSDKGNQISVRVNGQDVAKIFSGSYLQTRLSPGTHSFQTWVRTMGITSHSKIVSFDLAANRTYDIRLKFGGRLEIKEATPTDLDSLTRVPVQGDVEVASGRGPGSFGSAPQSVVQPVEGTDAAHSAPSSGHTNGGEDRYGVETARTSPAAGASSPGKHFLSAWWHTKSWTPGPGDTFEVRVTWDSVRELLSDPNLAALATQAMKERLEELGFVPVSRSNATLTFELSGSDTASGNLQFGVWLTRTGRDRIHEAWSGSAGLLACPCDPESGIMLFVQELLRCFPDLACYPPPSSNYPDQHSTGRYVSFP